MKNLFYEKSFLPVANLQNNNWNFVGLFMKSKKIIISNRTKRLILMQSLSPCDDDSSLLFPSLIDKLFAIKIIKINCVFGRVMGNLMGTWSSHGIWYSNKIHQQPPVCFMSIGDSVVNFLCHGKATIGDKHHQIIIFKNHSKDQCRFNSLSLEEIAHNSIIIININIKSGCDLFVIEPDDSACESEIWIIIHEIHMSGMTEQLRTIYLKVTRWIF